MKILYIDVNCKNSSTGQIVYSLFSKCKEHGIDAAVCYGRGPKIKEKGIYKFGLDIETYFHALMTRITGYTGCFSFFSTRRLLRYIKRFKPDIVHIHELHAYFVNIKPLLKYLRKNNIKTVFTNHCEFLYTGKCGHAQGCTRYSVNCGKCPLKKEYPSSLLFDHTRKMLNDKRKLLTGWDNAIFVSPSNWLNLKTDISFLKQSKRLVINNGIDTSVFSTNEDNQILDKYNIPKNKKIILSVAPDIFTENKGGQRFIEIANLLKSRTDIVFVAVGAICVPDNIPSNMVVVPLLTNKKELINFYSISDCLVICSRFENYPTTSLEAQCCGTKVIAYDVGGVKETILEGNGYVFPFNDNDKMSATISEIVDNQYSKEEVSKKAKEHLSLDKMFDSYLKLYCHQ